MNPRRSSRQKEQQRDDALIAAVFAIPIVLILIVGTWFLGMWPDWAYYESRCPTKDIRQRDPTKGIIVYTDENRCRTWDYYEDYYRKYPDRRPTRQ